MMHGQSSIKQYKNKLSVSRTHNCKPTFAHPGIIQIAAILFTWSYTVTYFDSRNMLLRKFI